MDVDILEISIKGSILGHLIGDALGYPYENLDKINNARIDMIPGKHEEPPGSWSMPGSSVLAILLILNEYSKIEPVELYNTLNDVYLGGHLTPNNECKDIGSIISESLQNYNNGIPPDKCSLDSRGLDNDALLRALPIGLYYATDSVDNLISNAHAISKLTHSDTISQVICALFCLLIKNILLQKSERVFDLLSDYYKTKKLDEYQTALALILDAKHNQISGSKNIIDSFWSAWKCYAEEQNNFEVAIKNAIALGHDTNGTACLTGALCGLNVGMNDIPYKWVKVLRLGSEHIDIIQVFVDNCVQKITTFLEKEQTCESG